MIDFKITTTIYFWILGHIFHGVLNCFFWPLREKQLNVYYDRAKKPISWVRRAVESILTQIHKTDCIHLIRFKHAHANLGKSSNWTHNCIMLSKEITKIQFIIQSYSNNNEVMFIVKEFNKYANLLKIYICNVNE